MTPYERGVAAGHAAVPLVIAFFAPLFLSRLLLWLLREWKGGWWRIFAVHLMSAAGCLVLITAAVKDTTPVAAGALVVFTLLSQLLWLAMDAVREIIRRRRAKREGDEPRH